MFYQHSVNSPSIYLELTVCQTLAEAGGITVNKSEEASMLVELAL